ncbi:four helix bundle protein [Pedobacter insulae]|uniref:Four helix bundle protein n=1 Tax=Pedobacter insulae TaxID=414048 RepID=A0A1I2Z2E5_9SPHI|nr:four helix bundle protein [Pedobacter insulae]SFH31151.1 four helix bundle protein [Pedobacter insulae]
MAYQKYTELEVWKKARSFASHIYLLTATFPKEEIYGLTSQIRRCAISIPSNIAEGSGRQSSKETTHFLSIARGSLFELETQLYIASDIALITEVQLDNSLVEVESLGKLINGYKRYMDTITQKPKNLPTTIK